MRRGTLFWGGLLIFLGLILLLDNLGFFGDVSIWGIIWPLVLIVLGAWILWGYRLRSNAETEHASIPLGESSRARLRINHGAGKLIVSAHDRPGVLAEGDFGGGLEVKTRQEVGLLDVSMSVPSSLFPFSWYPGYSLDWMFTIQQGIPISLEFNTGASENRIDLSEVQAEEIRLSTGASSTRITLPANAGITRLNVEAGAASVDITIPPGVAARIRSSSGLSSLELDRTRFPRVDGGYQSADYDSALNKADITVQMGAGSITVH
jgi:hypothetical protein